jgi:hypothetical protein
MNSGAWQTTTAFSGLTPNTTYNFEARKAETLTHLASPASPIASFTTDVAVKPTYTITAAVNNTTYGSITPYGAALVEEGNNITFTITAAKGYEIAEVLVDGINVPEAVIKGSYTFQNVMKDHTITANFIEGEKPVYKIFASVNNISYGNITPYGETSVEEGNDITFTITAASGYEIDEVLVDGTNVPEAVIKGSYTFQNVKEDHTIMVNFIEGVGIEEVGTDNYPSVRVYPNPTRGEIVVSSEYRVEGIEIFDVMGRRVQSFEFNVQSSETRNFKPETLNISGLPSGIYFVRIMTENGMVTKKIIKSEL